MVVSLGTALLWFGSEKSLERARARASECLDRVLESENPEPWQCVEDGRSTVARLSLFTRERALVDEARVRYEAASLAVLIAGRIDVDVERRDHEVARLLSSARAERVQPLQRAQVVEKLARAGALHFIPQYVLGSSSDSLLPYEYARAAAFHAGDFATVSLLSAAVAQNLEAGEYDPLRYEAWDSLVERRSSATAPKSTWHVARRGAESEVSRLPILAQTILREEHTVEGVIDWVERPSAPGGASQLQPSDRLIILGAGRLDYPRSPPFYDPAGMLRAARLLGRELDELDDAHAIAALELAAGLLAAEAGAEWLDRGELELAREAARAARAWLPSDHEAVWAGLSIFAGDEQAGIAWLDSRGPDVELGELELRALVGLERWPEARARAAHWRRRAEASGRDNLAAVFAKWQAALAVAADEVDPGPDQLGFVGWHEMEVNPELAAYLANPRSARRARTDWRSASLDRARPDLDLIVIARAAPTPESSEAWLDVHFIPQFLELGPRLYWARAQAARWRGDDESHQRWFDRLAALRGLAHTREDWLRLAIAFGLHR